VAALDIALFTRLLPLPRAHRVNREPRLVARERVPLAAPACCWVGAASFAGSRPIFTSVFRHGVTPSITVGTMRSHSVPSTRRRASVTHGAVVRPAKRYQLSDYYLEGLSHFYLVCG
jgi:hypothetical protein